MSLALWGPFSRERGISGRRALFVPSFQGFLGFFLDSDRIHTKDLTHFQQSGLYRAFVEFCK